jgi:hypothetical protein
MSDRNDAVKCPFCQGHGEIGRADLARLLDNNLLDKIETCPAVPKSEQVGSAGSNGHQARDFFKDVHTWNPKLPIWRRSPKE